MRKTSMKGFTLIELLIIVAIIAVLGALAIPQFGQFRERGSRAEARANLLEVAQMLERQHSASNSYVDFVLPTSINNSAHFSIEVSEVSVVAFTLEATLNNDSTCATLTLDNKGERGAVDKVTGKNEVEDPTVIARCWEK